MVSQGIESGGSTNNASHWCLPGKHLRNRKSAAVHCKVMGPVTITVGWIGCISCQVSGQRLGRWNGNGDSIGYPPGLWNRESIRVANTGECGIDLAPTTILYQSGPALRIGIGNPCWPGTLLETGSGKWLSPWNETSTCGQVNDLLAGCQACPKL